MPSYLPHLFVPAHSGMGCGRNEQHVNGQGQSIVERCEQTLEILREALNPVLALQNRTISSAIINITPLESLFGKVPNSSRMQIFGWAAYMDTENESRSSNLAEHDQLEYTWAP